MEFTLTKLRRFRSGNMRSLGKLFLQSAIGVVGIAAATWLAIQSRSTIATPICLDLIVIVFLSLRATFLSAAIVSVVAVGALDYYFTRPLYSLMVLDPIDGLVIVLFLITAAVITSLVARVRLNSQKLAATNARLEERIVELRRAQDQLQLSRMNRVMLMGEMTASIAHEVNQPLSGIVANAGTAMRYLNAVEPDVERARSFLQLIARDGKRAGQVVSRVRDLARLAPPRIAPISVNDVIVEVLAFAKTDLEQTPVEVRMELADDLPIVHGDRVQLQQVLMNLVVNALESMNGIDIAKRELLIRSRAGSSDANVDAIVIEVEDTGRGLDEAALDHLFKSFYTTKADGMGMGLSISRSIVEAHGGRLWAAAKQPHGAIFSAALPVAYDDAAGRPYT